MDLPMDAAAVVMGACLKQEDTKTALEPKGKEPLEVAQAESDICW